MRLSSGSHLALAVAAALAGVSVFGGGQSKAKGSLSRAVRRENHIHPDKKIRKLEEEILNLFTNKKISLARRMSKNIGNNQLDFDGVDFSYLDFSDCKFFKIIF